MFFKSVRYLKISPLAFFRNFSSNISKPTIKNPDINAEIRIRLAAAYRGLDAYGFSEGILNQLTAIAPGAEVKEDIMLVIPSGLHWSEVTPSNLIGINGQNEVVEGKGQPGITALCLHKGIYSRRPDVKAIMHTHMPYATALACLQNPELRMIHQNSTRFYQRIAYDTAYNGLGNTSEESKRLGDVLGEKDVLLMGNHGVLVVAQSIDLAFDDVYYLEKAAMIQILSCSVQKELKELDENVVKVTYKNLISTRPQYAKSHLDYVIRRLSTVCPEISLKLPQKLRH